MQGAVYALGAQDLGSKLMLFANYGVFIPFAYMFVFHLGVGFQGIWIACFSGQTLMALAMTMIVYTADWQKAADDAKDRLASSEGTP